MGIVVSLSREHLSVLFNPRLVLAENDLVHHTLRHNVVLFLTMQPPR